MPKLHITEPERETYIITDSIWMRILHLHQNLWKMLGQLEDPHTVVFLGDLFVIWLAPPKFWTELHRT
ncbi:MAG: hypothetical protein Ct9H300mP28_37050 [Pseudomonadota bacterium]|nr:MAG: hypothetical protein Ct9H300mP28_37050 [Pseudomonadota bacterium]